MGNRLTFERAGHGPVEIEITHGVIAGWTGRNADAVNHHIEELAAIGVPAPSTVPLYYRASDLMFTTAPVIQCLDDTSSGEAEPTLIDDGTRLYLGLGSDHTDRKLEAYSVAHSKQICPKPIAPVLWDFDEVAGHLDDIRIRSFIREGGDWVPYQDGTIGSIRPLAELVAGSPMTKGGTRLQPGTAMMCGTFAVLSGGVRAAEEFRMEMIDDRLGRRIEHVYTMVSLPVIA
ncbi:MAG: DUF2848 domain-containing protein [Paracoccaceae bacterium]|jgi:hypothetical protein|uniref:DUF2848 domain-containing protein n=1 Tax=unclassified Seohaeicola TaxID=2641111 RepID=UPI00237C20D7|nr:MULTISPECIES: DUF2848 domain-containing protein [unclassified Seohaeicola]MDD9706624.1 DUF2848 domain-containing protein [Seohaeicola sp. 4SK31]MDD9734330.1 DUF2848 domain-containing protein [Seohaeicola sp. SP36]MDM7968322.1 DUF2848 domain-containing protein [Paracoccaceae bacterium]